MKLIFKDGDTKSIKFGDKLRGKANRFDGKRPIGFEFEAKDSEDVKEIYHSQAAKEWYYLSLMMCLSGSSKDRMPNPELPKGFFNYEPNTTSA